MHVHRINHAQAYEVLMQFLDFLAHCQKKQDRIPNELIRDTPQTKNVT